MTGEVLSVFPVLRGPRTVLRELRPADAADLFVFRSDVEAQRYNDEPLREVADAVTLIDRLRAEFQAGEGVHWALALHDDDRVIGLFGLGSWDRHHRRAELGYDVHRDHWGRGLATEAVRAIVDCAFTTMDLNRIEALIIADNHPSIRLVRRVGFVHEGTRRACSWEDDGAFHDSAIYGLLRDDRGACVLPEEVLS
ncbi:GNAT family N-acetyltransferase [Microbacterium sp.]|uniref:GNAT family N-acetyltransferase n=1 Tax=Microbacterium sp. TaxID=51671 RepID=UPI0039E3285E